jgi:hypothetical protein
VKRLELVLLLWVGILFPSLAFAVPNVRLTSDGGSSQRPRVSLDTPTSAVVVWQDDRTGNFEIFWQRFDLYGTPLTTPVQITNTAGASLRPDVSCAASGNSHIVWQEGENPNGMGTVYFCVVDGAGLKIVNNTAVKTFSGHARVAARSDNGTDIVYAHHDAVDADVYFRRYNAAGTSACEKAPYPNSPPGVLKDPVVATFPDGVSRMLWREVSTSFAIHLREGQATASCGVSSTTALSNTSAGQASIATGGGYVFKMYALGGNIYNLAGSSYLINQNLGTASVPSIGADSHDGYVVWRDVRDGNGEIYFCRYWLETNRTGDVRLTSDAAESTAPDIAVDPAGSGDWAAVWEDARDGNREIYLTSRPLLDCPSPNLARVRVTAQVHQDHEGDPFIAPPPPLEGVAVKLVRAEGTYEGVTDANGEAAFEISCAPGGTFELTLQGPYYDLTLLAQDGSQQKIQQSVPNSPTGLVQFEWPWNRGLQLVYLFERFRKDFWRDRIEYVWRLPSRWKGLATDVMPGIVYERLDTRLQKAGGAAIVNGYDLACITNTCEESDVVFHEYTHNVVLDRFEEWTSVPRGFKSALSDGDGKLTGTSDYDQGLAMDEALSDYFAASFTHDPLINRCSGCLRNVGQNCSCGTALRDLRTVMKYPSGSFRHEGHKGSLILSGALWDLRSRIDGANSESGTLTDPLVFAAMDRLIHTTPTDKDTRFYMEDLHAAMVAVDADNGGLHHTAIEDAFQARGIGAPAQQVQPLEWPLNQAVTDVLFPDPASVLLRWRGLPASRKFAVEAAEVSYSYETGIAGAFHTIADSVSDSTFLFVNRDARTDYLFRIVPYDSTGQTGYPGDPVFVGAQDLTAVPVLGTSSRGLYCSPNPSTGSTRIQFVLQQPGLVKIEVYDVAGRRLQKLADGAFAGGRHEVIWNGRGEGDEGLRPGIYLVVASGRGWRDQMRVILLR